MSFQIRWSNSNALCKNLATSLEELLNAPEAGLPEELEGKLQVQELDLGPIPPEISIRKIEQFSLDSAGFIFHLHVKWESSSFRVAFKCKAQINPLYHRPSSSSCESFSGNCGNDGGLDCSSTFDSALSGVRLGSPDSRPFSLPITVGIEGVRFEGTMRISVFPTEGIANLEWLSEDEGSSFPNDDDQNCSMAEPLVEFRVFSTFDDVPLIRNQLQQAIELKVREALMNELPALVREYCGRLLLVSIKNNESLMNNSTVVDCDHQTEKILDSQMMMIIPKGGKNELLNASYATPWGLFVVENAMFSQFSMLPNGGGDADLRSKWSHSRESESEEGGGKFAFQEPIVISFPMRSRIYHFLATSSLFALPVGFCSKKSVGI